jgi:hypothetical protein
VLSKHIQHVGLLIEPREYWRLHRDCVCSTSRTEEPMHGSVHSVARSVEQDTACEATRSDTRHTRSSLVLAGNEAHLFHRLVNRLIVDHGGKHRGIEE